MELYEMTASQVNRCKELQDLLAHLGFASVPAYRNYMVGKARPHNGCRCYTEKRKDVTMTYSDNCRFVFGLAMPDRGIWVDQRFH